MTFTTYLINFITSSKEWDNVLNKNELDFVCQNEGEFWYVTCPILDYSSLLKK